MRESIPTSNILIVDDEEAALNNLAHVCRKEGYDVTTRGSGTGALNALEKYPFDVVLTDLRMEKIDGMAVLEKCKAISPETAVIVITGYATLDSAIDAMKAGAFHYVAKPYRLDEVRELIRSALTLVRLKRENQLLKNQLATTSAQTSIITQDPIMKRLLADTCQLAATDTNILITGESGTGKELLAQFIHRHSKRDTRPFQAINCGALQEDLLANELFGHEKGAYTGAAKAHIGIIQASDGGSLFLDEIAEMSLGMQVKLLRVLQEREVLPLGANRPTAIDIRLITATNRNLRDEVAAGRFREDLYYRLNVLELHLPPLSERKSDIPLLSFYFLRKHALRMDKNIEDIDTETMVVLQDYDYPGNIRELENIIERGVALARTNLLTVADLPATLVERAIHVVRENKGRLPTLAERESDYISYVLEHNGNNRTKAAKVLGIDRVSLWRKLKKYGMED